jgi:precorrin-6B methylase 2
MSRRITHRLVLSLVLALAAASKLGAQAQSAPPFQPQVGQPGKDVVWVPTPQAVVDTMLNLAKLTPQDFLIDLGSGDGRTVITAAKRGSRALGVEFNHEMVELSKRNAASAGVAERAAFVEADLFETDLSKAQVITMFLLPTINLKLRPKLLDLAPGTRIVSNTFRMEEWEPDASETVSSCNAYCTAFLWIVPAKVEGDWRLPQGVLTLSQAFQKISGNLGGAAISNGGLHGSDIAFTVGAVQYTGRVAGGRIEGTMSTGQSWTATR